MRAIFGPNTRQVLQLLTSIHDLSAEEIDRVAALWKQTSSQTRAEAWAQVQRTTTADEWYRIRIASSVARKAALEVARNRQRPDWAFWAAVSDAAAALADSDRMGEHYDVLIAPLAAVIPSLARRRPEQRPRAVVFGRGAQS